MACLDTTFLIDLIRESRYTKLGPATALLKELLDGGETLSVTLFHHCRTLCGASDT
jgi:hypothetical protein